MSAAVDREAFIRSGRSEKVARMCAVIDAHAQQVLDLDPVADAELVLTELRKLPTDEKREAWHKIQTAAAARPRKKPPSDETINAVLEVFERRVLAAARFDEPESGEFAPAPFAVDDYFDEEAV